MKTEISIPDAIFKQAERLAKARGWSRSELYASAVAAYVIRETLQGTTTGRTSRRSRLR